MEHRQIVETMMKAVDARDYAAIEDLLTEDCEFAAPGFQGTGRASVVTFMRPFLDAFPDLTHELEGFVDGDDSVAFELHIRGTHTAPMASPQGEIPPTGKRVDFWSCDMVRLRDGRYASYHVYFDQLDFMGQLGLLPG
jgi:predicted ester cyclase